ncbi:unnamed protein product, partial [Symbiodinium sp. CCMP2456]
MASQLTSGSVCRDDVKQLVENLNIFTLDTHSFVESSGSLKPLDLPLVDSPTAGFLKCFVDIITDVSAFPKTEIKQALVSKKIHELPAPYGLTQKIDTPTKIDIAVINQNNGTFCVVKIVNLSEKTKVSRVQNLCYGKCQAVDWVGDIKAVKKIREEGKPEADRTPEEWDYGFDFIQDHGPRENIKNRQLRWITKEIARKDSPICKWPPVLVEKSLRNLAQDGVLSQVHEVWPLTLYDLDIRILRALEPLIPTLVEKADGFHGLPGACKTPVARTLAMAISRYWIHKARKDGEIRPSFRQACDFDFFRGQAGSLMRPDIFDDGTLSDQPFRKVKAFTYVSNIESMPKERWGAAKWAKGQPRIYCVNEFEENTEPKFDQSLLQQAEGISTYVSHDDFLKMLEPSWYPKENSNANVMAVLKRTHNFLNTATSLYVRPAGEKPCPVLRHPLGDKTDYLHRDSRSVCDFHRKGGTDLPDDFETKLQWESNWFSKAMSEDT